MATVTPLFSFGDRNGGDLLRPSSESDGTSAALSPLPYLVSGLVVGEDPRSISGIPQPGTAISVGGTSYLVDRVGTAQYITDGTNNSAHVSVYCSTDRRFRFPPRPIVPVVGDWNISTSFRTESRRAPTFVTREVIIPQASGAELGSLEWAQDLIPYTVDFDVLQVSATLPEPISKDAFLDLHDLAAAQNGFLHRFRNKFWRFTPPHFDRSSVGYVSIVYVWESDPGNWEIGANFGAGTAPGHRRAAPLRYSFTEYQVVGSGGFGLPPPLPVVVLGDLYPDQANNPYVDLDGWQDLPGNPLG